MTDELLKAIMNDSLNVINSYFPVPSESILWLYSRMKKNPVNQYLDLNRGSIRNYYTDQENKKLNLYFNNETEVLPQYLEIDNTINHLDMSHFIFEFEESVFELPSGIKEHTQEAYKNLVKNLHYTNEENLRLRKLSIKNGVYTFHTQPVYYEDYLHSNMLMDYKVDSNKTLRGIIHKDGQLETLQESKLANHLGINILLFTPAGSLILPLRSKKVSYAPSEYSSSISGAVSAHDVSTGNKLSQLSILREGIEELGLKRTDILIESIKFLGLSRELIRGGKPELFFTINTKLTREEINNRWNNAKDKWENKTLEFYNFDEFILNPIITKKDQEDFQDYINKLFIKYGGKMSLPLMTNLSLWIKFKQNGY